MNLRSFLKDELDITNTKCDISFYVRHDYIELHGMLGTYVDNILYVEKGSFQSITDSLEERIES